MNCSSYYHHHYQRLLLRTTSNKNTIRSYNNITNNIITRSLFSSIVTSSSVQSSSLLLQKNYNYYYYRCYNNNNNNNNKSFSNNTTGNRSHNDNLYRPVSSSSAKIAYNDYLSHRSNNSSSSSSSIRNNGKSVCCSSSSQHLLLQQQQQQQHSRWLSTSSAIADNNNNNNNRISKVQIVYGSQTGTAQLFAMQLADEIDGIDVDYCTCNELEWNDNVGDDSNNTLYVFIVSTAGIGEPPDNAREFYQSLINNNNVNNGDKNDHYCKKKNIPYVIFALGNSKAHSSHFCAFGKDLDTALQKHIGVTPIMPITLGDDGADDSCVEDDFDQFQTKIINYIQNINNSNSNDNQETITPVEQQQDISNPLPLQQEQQEQQEQSTGITVEKRVMINYPKLILQKIQNTDDECTISGNTTKLDLLDYVPNFYQVGTKRFPVLQNYIIRPNNTSVTALHEMQLQIFDIDNDDIYETGDHIIIYPQHSDVLIEAYLNVLDDKIDPMAIITKVDTTTNNTNNNNEKKSHQSYPHPIGISVYDTLQYCVDLQALPSPTFARYITNNNDNNLDYKKDIVIPRKNILQFIKENNVQLSLEELLYNIPPLQPRYYSIASSANTHPDTIYLTYRPVKYITTTGTLREGVCTSYMNSIVATSDNNNSNRINSPPITVAAAIRSNPTFRLPKEPNVPIVMIAGGCGVAPIRAFLEELIWNAKQSNDIKRPYGKVYLFIGFRNPIDSVYDELIEEADKLNILNGKYITYNTGCVDKEKCGLVSDAVQKHGKIVYELIAQNNASTYICGGARTFGVAIQNTIQSVLQQYGNMDTSQSTNYLRELIQSGRFHEDLSD